MPLFLLCFLSSFYHFLSFFLFSALSFSIFFTTVFIVGLSSLIFHYLLPMGPSSLPLRCLPYMLPPLPSSMATTPLYSGLIPWDFCLLPLRFHQLFWVCCGHPFRTAHPSIGCSTTTTTRVNLIHYLSSTTHSMTKSLFVCSYYLPLPLGSNG